MFIIRHLFSIVMILASVSSNAQSRPQKASTKLNHVPYVRVFAQPNHETNLEIETDIGVITLNEAPYSDVYAENFSNLRPADQAAFLQFRKIYVSHFVSVILEPRLKVGRGEMVRGIFAQSEVYKNFQSPFGFELYNEGVEELAFQLSIDELESIIGRANIGLKNLTQIRRHELIRELLTHFDRELWRIFPTRATPITLAVITSAGARRGLSSFSYVVTITPGEQHNSFAFETKYAIDPLLQSTKPVIGHSRTPLNFDITARSTDYIDVNKEACKNALQKK